MIFLVFFWSSSSSQPSSIKLIIINHFRFFNFLIFKKNTILKHHTKLLIFVWFENNLIFLLDFYDVLRFFKPHSSSLTKLNLKSLKISEKSQKPIYTIFKIWFFFQNFKIFITYLIQITTFSYHQQQYLLFSDLRFFWKFDFIQPTHKAKSSQSSSSIITPQDFSKF